MATIAIGNGVSVELPDEWTPVIDSDGFVDRALATAWTAHNEAVIPEAYAVSKWLIDQRWPTQLFRLWQKETIELAGRTSWPGAPLLALDYPVTLRYPESFSIEREGLVHLRSERVHYDLHYRVRATATTVAAPPPQPDKPPAGKPIPARATTSVRADTRRRDTMLYEVWEAVRFPNWQCDEAFQSARDRFTDKLDQKILNVGSTARHNSWVRVQKMRPLP